MNNLDMCSICIQFGLEFDATGLGQQTNKQKEKKKTFLSSKWVLPVMWMSSPIHFGWLDCENSQWQVSVSLLKRQ